MNQIPNIDVEKEITRCVVEAWREHRSVTGAVKEIMEILHHQLQKARQDWLREEIVKLEGMKKEKEFVEKEWKNEDCSGTTGRWEDYTEHNQALQTIIDRYHSELDQTRCCEKYNGTVDITKSCIFCKTYLGAELDQDVSNK